MLAFFFEWALWHLIFIEFGCCWLVSIEVCGCFFFSGDLRLPNRVMGLP